MKVESAKMMKLAMLVCAGMAFHFSLSTFHTLHAQDSILRVSVSDNLYIDMVWVPGGTFTMGSNETPKGVRLNYESARPEHRVTVDGFYIGRYEVTQGLWRAILGENPSKFTGNDSLPVECVSWTEAQQFAILLSQLTGKRFRLPTEAEWEYAARGGERPKVKADKTPFAGCGRDNLGDYCWYCATSKGHTHPVGQLNPNVLGLYDMSGNVAEWCLDWVETYGAEEQTNPRGPRDGENRVLRGGHYNSVSAACTVYDRGWYLPSGKYEFYGLRLVMEEEK